MRYEHDEVTLTHPPVNIQGVVPDSHHIDHESHLKMSSIETPLISDGTSALAGVPVTGCSAASGCHLDQPITQPYNAIRLA
jgi:hypothetical protein